VPVADPTLDKTHAASGSEPRGDYLCDRIVFLIWLPMRSHTVQQVSDWIRYCRQNQTILSLLLGGVSPDGMVVIGRSRYLNEKEREVLAHNNQGRDVKVIPSRTAGRFWNLILHR
jgi:hypothetical protein